MLPILAIVGRPNVGKSTLFNRLTKTHNAIVGDLPGLTRDRQYGTAIIQEKNFIIVDTGGIGEITNAVEELMSKQTEFALEEADAILFLVDAHSGITYSDQAIAKKLHKTNKPVFLVVNKTDGVDVNSVLADFYSLGFAAPFPISAEQGQGLAALTAAIISNPRITASTTETIETQGIKIAFVGRPNVGKSTLVNRILGEERVVVYDAPGTTRDSIFINFKRLDKDYVLIDTAGIRRRSKIHAAIEKFSIIKAMQAIEASNVVVLLIDAKENITDQDLKLLGLIIDAGKALVIAVNKWDNLPEMQREKIKSELERRLKFIDYAAIYFISALHGTGVGNLFTAIEQAYQSANRELKTSDLTEVIHHAFEQYQPPLVHRAAVKFRLAHMGGHNPPVIVIHGSRVSGLPEHYKKYLEKYLRNAMQLSGTPIRLEFKEKK